MYGPCSNTRSKCGISKYYEIPENWLMSVTLISDKEWDKTPDDTCQDLQETGQ